MPPFRTIHGWEPALRALEHPQVRLGGAGAPVQAPGSLVPGTPTPSGSPTGSGTSTFNIFPWWLYEYESAQDWYLNNILFNVAAGVQNFAVPAFTFAVPNLNRMVLKQVIIGIQNPTNLTNVTVALLRTGNPIAGFNALAFLPMNAATQDLPFNGLNLRFSGQDVFSATVSNNNAGTAWVCNIQASGWYVPQVDIDRLQGPVRY